VKISEAAFTLQGEWRWAKDLNHLASAPVLRQNVIRFQSERDVKKILGGNFLRIMRLVIWR
jgi:hypothetical protein